MTLQTELWKIRAATLRSDANETFGLVGSGAGKVLRIEQFNKILRNKGYFKQYQVQRRRWTEGKAKSSHATRRFNERVTSATRRSTDRS